MPSWAKEILGIHELAIKKKITPWSDEDIRFLALALCGEAGEFANMIKKHWRGDKVISPRNSVSTHNELVDIRVYTELLAHALGIDLNEAVENKLPEIRAKFMQLPRPLTINEDAHGLGDDSDKKESP